MKTNEMSELEIKAAIYDEIYKLESAQNNIKLLQAELNKKTNKGKAVNQNGQVNKLGKTEPSHSV